MQHYKLCGLVERVHEVGVDIKAAGGVGRARDVFSYQRAIDDLIYILKGLAKNIASHIDIILISSGDLLTIEQEQTRMNKK